MRLGVLDLGSNSVQLQVVDAVAGTPPLPVRAVKESTHLGEEVGEDGSISKTGLARVTSAVEQAISTAREFDVEWLYPFATAAIRDSANRETVLDRIETQCGVRVQVLSGEQEARLTYAAVRRWYGWQAGRMLMIDIGGGSMELAFGRDLTPEFAVSLPLGAGRTTREFFGSAPVPSGKQVKALKRRVDRELGEVADRIIWEGKPRQVVVTSKTFRQLARLCGAPKVRKGPFVRRTLATDDLARCMPRLQRMSPAQRARLRGVSAARASQILAGAVVALETLRYLQIAQAEVSPWGLREGVVLQHLAALTQTNELPLHPLHLASAAAAASGDAIVTTLPPRSAN
jgi:exopolyphosphatase/guanosine-5'-triphosphate,3'-diphosphate pyrophosphatase